MQPFCLYFIGKYVCHFNVSSRRVMNNVPHLNMGKGLALLDSCCRSDSERNTTHKSSDFIDKCVMTGLKILCNNTAGRMCVNPAYKIFKFYAPCTVCGVLRIRHRQVYVKAKKTSSKGLDQRNFS